MPLWPAGSRVLDPGRRAQGVPSESLAEPPDSCFQLAPRLACGCVRRRWRRRYPHTGSDAHNRSLLSCYFERHLFFLHERSRLGRFFCTHWQLCGQRCGRSYRRRGETSAVAPSEPLLPFSGGAITIGANGKGTLKLTDETGTIGFSIVMTSTTAGLITQTDGVATPSGKFNLQTPGTFAVANINTNYAFDFSGVDSTGVPRVLDRPTYQHRRRHWRRSAGSK